MTTQTELDEAKAARSKILQMQETRGGDTSFRRADLAEVNKLINQLELKLARETARANGQAMRRSVANFNTTRH